MWSWRNRGGLLKLYTIGHSNLSIDQFLSFLKKIKCEILIDIRARPFSSRFPHFKKDALRESLELEKIHYHWAGLELGGMRQASADSKHVALHDDSLRAYADHTQSDAFLNGVNNLVQMAGKAVCVLMCAERIVTDCHRSILSDFLILKGHDVLHIQGEQLLIHTLHPCARRESAELVYDRFVSADLFLQD